MFGVFSDNLPKEDRDWLRDIAIFSTLFFVLAAGGYIYTFVGGAPIPRDGTTLNVGRDYLNFWMYGHAALTDNPSRFYDHKLYNEELARMFGLVGLGLNWSYPPSIMLLALPFAQIGYIPSLVVWTFLSVVLFALVAGRHVPDRRLLIPLVFSPAAVFCLMSGQSSFVTTAMLIGIFAWLDRRPLAAGILIGLLSLKPQLGLLFPVMLIASGRWRVFLVAALTAVALAAATAVVFGANVWIDFIEIGMPTQNFVLRDPELLAAPFMPTIFMGMRILGASYAGAMAVQACFTILAIATVFWAFRYRRDADPQLLAALFFACTIAGAPYLLVYDTLPLTFAAVVLVAAGKLDPLGRRLAQLVYWLPLLQIGLGTLHIPGAGLIPSAFAVYVLTRVLERKIRPLRGTGKATEQSRCGGLSEVVSLRSR